VCGSTDLLPAGTGAIGHPHGALSACLGPPPSPLPGAVCGHTTLAASNHPAFNDATQHRDSNPD